VFLTLQIISKICIYTHTHGYVHPYSMSWFDDPVLHEIVKTSLYIYMYGMTVILAYVPFPYEVVIYSSL
jgi:hypothetical protein